MSWGGLVQHALSIRKTEGHYGQTQIIRDDVKGSIGTGCFRSVFDQVYWLHRQDDGVNFAVQHFIKTAYDRASRNDEVL